MSSSAVRILCPNLQCRTVLSVPAAARGKTVRCRNCSMRIQVPAGSKTVEPGSEAEAASSDGKVSAKK